MPDAAAWFGGDPEHLKAIELMKQANSATSEAEANRLIGEAQAAAQRVSGTRFGGDNKAAIVFEAVTEHARKIQEKLVSQRTPSDTPDNNNVTTATSGANYYYSPSPPPPPPAPILPNFKGLSTTALAIKQAPIDTIVFNNDLVDMENMAELLYEDIAGLELANISREDLVNGQEVIYSPISNLSSIYKLFNPNNIISTSSTSQTYFSRFAIDLILRGMNEPYLDINGDLIVEINDVLDEEEIHVQITSSGTIELVEL